jgi:ribonuclease VapC
VTTPADRRAVVIDTSAIVAFLIGEPEADAIEELLMSRPCFMSAATWVELGIVVEARVGASGVQLLDELRRRIGLTIVPVDEAVATEALIAWRRFGKGRHAAALNYGDTFSYGLARHLAYPLLSIGADFAQTDIESA